jgi:hypothetical protein
MDVHDLARALHQHGFVGKWASGEHSWSGIGAAYLLAEAMWHPTWQPFIEAHTRAAVEAERAAADAVITMADNLLAEQMGVEIPRAWVAAVNSYAARKAQP